MKLLKSGKGNPPSVKDNQTLFVDMWENWYLYTDYYSTFNLRVETFVNDRKSEIPYFNSNYIRTFIHK